MLKKITLTASSVALLAALTACGDDATPATGTDAAASATADATSDAATQASSITIADPWVKATDEEMTAAFATFTNDTGADIVITGASTDVAGMVELHETVENADGSKAMQEREGGFVVPAGGTLALAPGAEHIMLMGLGSALEAGTTVTIALTFEDGSTTDVEATVKAFDGADEQYQIDRKSVV